MLDNGIDLNIYKTMYLSNKTYQLTDRPKNNLRVICNFYRNQIAEHSTEMVGVAEWLGHRSCILDNPQFCWTFYMNIYFCEQWQKEKVEGHLFN